MKIRMKAHFAGSGFSFAPGDEIDWPEAEAVRLIKKGYAVPVNAAPVETTAAMPADEFRADHRKKHR